LRVLIVGSGGREHALAWKVSRSPHASEVLVAPGNAGMEDVARRFPDVSGDSPEAVVELAARESADLVVVGPEAPLAAGLADRLREAGFAVFGPSQQAARLESSKEFAKDFMRRHGIPTAAYQGFGEVEAAVAYAKRLGGPCVVKADGLAAGKGVAMCETAEAAEAAIQETMGDRRFGEAGARVVIEDWMQGEEASYLALTDGTHVVSLAASQDHKRALDGDRGENTGGMGAYAPAPVVTEAVEKRVLEEIVYPTIRGMAAEGCPYQGVLYVGLMIDADGAPRVVEYNVRFGDPEIQALLVQMESDLLPLLAGVANGRLEASESVAWADAAVCVVLASEGYPRSYEKGKPITGLDVAAGDPSVVVFHAGTGRAPDGGFVTSGGRVLGVTGRGESLAEALERTYAACEAIHFDGAWCRKDIAKRGLDR